MCLFIYIGAYSKHLILFSNYHANVHNRWKAILAFIFGDICLMTPRLSHDNNFSRCRCQHYCIRWYIYIYNNNEYLTSEFDWWCDFEILFCTWIETYFLVLVFRSIKCFGEYLRYCRNQIRIRYLISHKLTFINNEIIYFT